MIHRVWYHKAGFALQAGALTLLLCTPVSANAGGGASMTLEGGPDEYRSRSYSAYMDINERGWQFGLDFFDADSGGLFPLQSYGAWLGGNLGESLYVGASANLQEDDQIEVQGAALNTSLYLNTLLGREPVTRVDLGYERSTYARAGGAPLPAGFEFPVLQRIGVGISQDVGSKATLYASHDSYSYSRDPVAVAKFLVRRLRVPPSKVFFLTAFPDRTTSAGLTVYHRNYGADLNYSETNTVLGETTKSYSLSPTWYVNDNLSVGASVTRSETNGFGSTFYSLSASLYK